MIIPREAREGLARAWLAHLREQHPGLTWVIVSDTSSDEDDDLGAEEAGRKGPGHPHRIARIVPKWSNPGPHGQAQDTRADGRLARADSSTGRTVGRRALRLAPFFRGPAFSCVQAAGVGCAAWS